VNLKAIIETIAAYAFGAGNVAFFYYLSGEPIERCPHMAVAFVFSQVAGVFCAFIMNIQRLP